MFLLHAIFVIIVCFSYRTTVRYSALGVAAADDDDANSGKQLVVIAGPHKTTSTSVEEFFYSFARGDNPGD